MENLNIQNSRFITYIDDIFTVDVLGGVDTQQIERMICTLRITYQNYPPLRSTLDLYNDNQTDKQIRTLCDKWELPLLDVSKSVHSMIAQLESYKLERLKYPKQKAPDFEPSQEETKTAKAFLRSKNLANELVQKLNKIGVLGEDENALILFLALASYKFYNPFSVICLAKSGIGKSYILQKLSECMPKNAYSFHTKISANALYYFDSHQLNGKALFIEDLEWTSQMLQPLATLQTQGRLVNTRATKDKDGMLHSTTFEVVANLCLLACAYSDKNFEEISLPFLCLHLNHSHAQDLAIMEYQKKCKAGLLPSEEVTQTQQLLQCVIATLQNIRVINPFAPLISLPEEVSHPRKSFLVLLNFIEVITYFFQYQREQTADEQTGEVLIKTHPNDIELAFKLLKSSLFRRADELNTTARGFYNWLKKYLTEAKTNQFTTLDIRKAKAIHPRTLNRYLQELKLFDYIQVVGGNKHREGYRYKLSEFGNQNDKQNQIEQSIQATLKAVWNEYNKQNGKEEIKEAEPSEKPKENTEAEPSFFEKNYKRKRINEKEKHTFKLLLELEAEQPNREYLSSDFTAITGRSQTTEARHLKTLWEQGKLNRKWKDRQYIYTLVTNSKTVSQNGVTNSQPIDTQDKNSRTT
jgi:DNA-binding HxlR family transcriptional regulator